MDNFKFSVIIITRNRANVLSGVLESVIKQNYEKEKYEIIVVDNNSTDNTALVVKKFKGLYPNMSYVFEPEIGMSKARNRGAQIATGEILVFIDDDGIAESNWLKNYEWLYESYHDFVAWGGKIELIFESKPPTWLSEELMVALSYFNYSNEEVTLCFPVHPFGCNFSVKRKYFWEVGGFIEKLKNSNEEKAFFNKLHFNNYKVGFSPKVLVSHRIPSLRLNKKYFIKRGIKQGIGNIQYELILNSNTLSMKKKSKRLLIDGFKIIRNILISPKKYSFNQIYYFFISLGEFLGLFIQKIKRYEYHSYSNKDETS